MTWIQRIFAQSSPDAQPEPRDPNNPFWWNRAGARSQTGMVVDEDTALRISAVWGAVQVISSAIAGVPLITYQTRPDGGKDRVTWHPVYDLLHDEPNTEQSAFEWREYMTACALLWGNGYARILPGPRGPVDQLDVPYHPSCVTPEIDPRTRRIVRYTVRYDDGSTERILPDQMFHLRGLSKDGLVGMSVISFARESMGLSLATEAYGARLFSQDATPTTILTHPGELSEAAAKRIRLEWDMLHAGLNNAHSTAVLEEGMNVVRLGMTNEDSQFLQTRQFSIRDIARWFSIQPHMIQDLQNATFTNIEQQSLEFVTYTLARWAVRWEQTVKRKLLIGPQFFAEHLFDALLRGDTLTRNQAYNIALGRWMSGNEIRARENMNPKPGLDDILPPVQVRETIADQTTTPPVPPPAASMSDLDILVRSNGHDRH